MHFSLWFLDFMVNVCSTNVRALSCLGLCFFYLNVSTSTEIKFYTSPSQHFQSKSIFFLLLQSTNIHNLGPQITDLYHCTLRFQRNAYSMAFYSYLNLSSRLQDYAKQKCGESTKSSTQNFPFFLLTSSLLLFCSLCIYS